MRILFSLAALSCYAYAAEPKSAADLKSDKQKFSYVVGTQVGQNMKKQNVELDFEAFAAGLKHALQGKPFFLTKDEQQKVMMAFQSKMEEKAKVDGDKNTKDGKAFLAENAKKPGVKTTASGLQYKVIKEGTGAIPKATDTVVTHYRGTLIDGKEFDSSYSRGEPATFPVGGVIKGWTEALQLMKTGSKWQLFIPSELAYGPNGAGGMIGANATLIFDIELLEIKGAKTATK